MAELTPPLTWLRAFEAAARHLSFTRAGEELGLTQSAISQHVRALEAHLGQPLFRRDHRQLRLSEAGRLMVPDVTAGLQTLSQAARRFRQDPTRAHLRIASSASVAHHILAPRISEFAALHPNVVLDLRTAVWPDDFIATGADVEVRFGSADMVAHNAIRLEPSNLIAVASPSSARLFNSGSKVPLVQPVGLSTTWADIIPHAVPDLRVDTHGLAVDLACQGAGMALVHCLIAAEALNAGRLIKVDTPEIPAKEGYYLAQKSGVSNTLAQAFSDWLLETALEIVPK